MAQKKRTSKTSQGKHGGGGKVALSRLQLALLGKGPTERAARQMYAESLKAPGAKPKKDRAA